MKDSLFSHLTVRQQAEILFNQGYYLSTREGPGFVVDMYQLESLFIELYFPRNQTDFVVVKTFYSAEDVEANTSTSENISHPCYLSW